jgi:hypothetical protein
MEQYEELPDDDYAAFMRLESEFRRAFESNIQDHNSNYEHESADYMNKTLAAAKALGIDALSKYEVTTSSRNREFADIFAAFFRDVDNIIIQIRVHNSRRAKAMSVGLSPEQKTKIHGLIEKICKEIEASSASVGKKEKLYSIIANLMQEVSKARTGLERFGDLARGLSGISKEVAQEGAEPWWKWFKAAMRTVDEAKEAEPQLPKPPEVMRIEPPRKELPKPGRSDLDDEVPF